MLVLKSTNATACSPHPTSMCVKILHLIGQLNRGGAERQLLLVSKELAARGWHQTILTFDPGRPWDDIVRGNGSTLLQLPRRKNRLGRLVELHKIIRREQPCIVHSWSHHTNVYAGYLRAICTFPFVSSLRSNPLADNYTGEPLTNIRNSRAYKRADCIVGNSYLSLASARRGGLIGKRFRLVGNIHIPQGSAFPEEPSPCPNIATVGTLKPIKGHRILFQALARLKAAGHNFRLFVVGDGPERQNLERLKIALGLAERIEFLGELDRVDGVLKRCHLLVHPSIMEGLSNAVLEGMGACLPVCASAVGAIPEFIHDKENGLLVPPSDEELLAEKIAWLLSDPSLRACLGRKARETVETLCNPNRVVDTYEQTYASLVHSESSFSAAPRRFGSHRVSKPVFLMYHNLLPEAQPSLPVACEQLTWRSFRDQMRALRDQVLDPLEVHHLQREGKRCPEGFVVTLDDGGAGLLRAAEILSELNLKAVAFICPGALTEGLWFYRIAAALAHTPLKSAIWRGLTIDLSTHSRRRGAYSLISKLLLTEIPSVRNATVSQLEGLLHTLPRSEVEALRILNYKELCLAADTGSLLFGNHSHTHSCLPFLPDRDLRREVCAAQEWLDHCGLPTLPWFALPWGEYDDRVLAVLEESKLLVFGAHIRSTDAKVWPRLGVSAADMNFLRFKLKTQLNRHAR